MKYLIALLVMSSQLSWGAYQKPELLSLYFSTQNYNLDQDTYCYLGTPTIYENKRIINCLRGELHDLVMWDEQNQSHIFFTSKNFVSVPQYFDKTLTWYEYDQMGILAIHQWKDGEFSQYPIDEHARSVTYLGDKWIYHSHEGLTVRSEGKIEAAKIDNVSYVFNPSVSNQGDFAVKIRRGSLSNSSPDEIWSYRENKWMKVFSDKDSDPLSPWISFNNSLATGDGKVYVIAFDRKGEALVEVSELGQRVLAREGVEVKKFESFSIAYNNGSVVFRAIDHENRKVIYVHDGGKLNRVLTQGDTVLLPNGRVGQIDYPNVNSIIYNNPTIGEDGEVIIQATMLDFEDRSTLVGVGVISIRKDNL